ncbi:MAG: cupin domain-containing protein [Bacteroidia bacterium]|nr:cupin domain-containing protein [Bacteroidia bacterium]
MGNSAAYWITKLGLEEHPEGGFFREVYRSDEQITQSGLPERYSGERSISTSIYFLLTSEKFSAFHKVNSDEGWHYYQGTQPVILYIISPEGKLSKVMLGPAFELGQKFQHVVPANHWFAAAIPGEGNYALVGCTVAPGFDFEDFELAKKDKLQKKFPSHKSLINKMCRS